MKRIIALLIFVVAAISALSACVVMSVDGYYDRPYYYHPYYRGY